MQYNNTKDTEKLLKIFYSDEYGFEEEELSKSLKEVVKYYDKHTRHQYHIISRFVNERMQEGEDAVSYILNNIDAMLAFLEYRRENCDQIIRESSDLEIDKIILNLEKLYDHIALEEERLKNNAVNMRVSNNQIQNNVMNTFNSIMDSFQGKVDEVSGSLNANIITVVGLFSAIIFVFLGGITGMSALVKGICELTNKKELTIPLICVCAVGFVIFNIVFLLLYSISKIVDKNIGTTVNGREYVWYDIEKKDENCYEIIKNGKSTGKYCNTQQKVEKKIKWKQRWWNIREAVFMCIKKVLFRFPYVLIVNIIFVVGIIYLYKQL